MLKPFLCKFKKINYRHYVCIVITVVFLLINLYCFRYSFFRLGESFRDFGLSFWYVICDFFNIEDNIPPTVTSLSGMPFTVFDWLPDSWEVLKQNINQFFDLFFDKVNFSSYFNDLSLRINNFSRLIIVIFIFLCSIGIVVIPFFFFKKEINNDYGKETKFLKVFKKVSKFIFNPVKSFFMELYQFIKEHKFYVIIWSCIWAINFNFFSIVIEFAAYYYYFVISFDIGTIYTQFYKLCLDLSVMFKFVPWPFWVLLCILIFLKCRKKIGYSVLEHHELKNRGFINQRGIFCLFVAPMRQGKTKASVSFALSREVLMRNMAYDTILKSDLKFPNFPWINLENYIKHCMRRGYIYNLATVRKSIDDLKFGFFNFKGKSAKAYRRYLRRKNGYIFNNLLFGYDFKRYPIHYDNAKYLESLFDVLKDYAQAYFIYVIESSLILSNYSIRVDNVCSDVGNFPIWDDDFFHVSSYDVDVISRHSHILNYDTLRLGKKVAGESKFAFEFGIIDITEIAKERLNMIESSSIKKSDVEANQKNDGFDNWVKMCGHNATIDFKTYVSIYADEQREDSLPASLREVGEILRIEDTKKDRLAMPFFFLEETVYQIIHNLFIRKHKQTRYLKGNTGLFYYLIHNIQSKVESYHDRIINTFGYEVLMISVQDGAKNNEKSVHKYYISNKKDLSKRYSTDCLNDTLAVRSLRATWGLEDEPTYRTEKASFDETKKQNSYFIRDITEQVLGCKEEQKKLENKKSFKKDDFKHLF